MNKDIKQILAIAAGVAALVLGAMVFLGSSETTVVHPPVNLPNPGEQGPTGAPAAVVIDLHREQETSFFGFRKGETRYVVGVQFYVPAPCADLVTDDVVWPVPDGECATEVPIAGVANIVGIAATGESIIVVNTEVPAECFGTIGRGDWWPPDASECDS